jgi:LmbE family N-acetylglucosaminyl deacetylase
MGDQVSNSLQTATKVVIVYVTAGDGGDTQTYWSTRELAARAAIDAYVTSGTWTCTQQVINTHPLHRCAKGKVVSIDMRLPNGTGQGTDFNGRGTLNMLRDGASSSLAAIDGSGTYASWADVTTTIGRIVDFESNNASAPLVEVHAPETNRTTNRNDHADHLAVGDAVLAASGSHSWNLNWYVDYQTSNLAINLTQAVHNRKQLAFYAYDGYMGSRGYGYERYDQLYQDWLWRTYVRRQTP